MSAVKRIVTHIGGWQVVWTLEQPDNKLKPHAVRVGITNYTVTQMLEGDLTEGMQLVTLQTGGNKNAQAGRNPLTPQQQGRGGPGGRGGR